MLDHIAVVSIVLLAVLLTVLLLGAGTAVGYRFGLTAGARMIPTILPTPEDAVIDQLTICRRLVEQMHARSSDLLASAAHLASLPDAFRGAIEGLVELARELANQLEQTGPPSPPRLGHTPPKP